MLTIFILSTKFLFYTIFVDVISFIAYPNPCNSIRETINIVIYARNNFRACFIYKTISLVFFNSSKTFGKNLNFIILALGNYIAVFVDKAPLFRVIIPRYLTNFCYSFGKIRGIHKDTRDNLIVMPINESPVVISFDSS